MKKNKFLVQIIFIGIIIIASLLRLWALGQTPVSLNWDEASWGYNAFALLETGRDEFGRSFPLIIQSFGDYKPALYMYLVAPFIFLFGLSDGVIRFPNAVAGIVVVIASYFLVKELFAGRKDIGLLTMFLIAISPWAIQFSRFAHEGMMGLAFNLLMILFFLKSFKKPKYLLLSAIFAGLSIYSYQGEKIFVPLFLIILLISFYKEFIKIPKKYIGLSVLVGFLVIVPMILSLILTPESLSRVKGTSLASGPEVLNLEFYPERNLVNSEKGDVVGKVIDNRRVLYAKAIVGNYLIHFDPNYLFVNGEWIIKRHQPPHMGHLYLIELPFMLLGLYFFIFGKYKKSTKKFVFLWILAIPLVAALTWDVPNSGRTMNMLPALLMLVAIGILGFYNWLMNLKISKYIQYMILLAISVLAIFNFIYYVNHYFVQYNYFDSRDWQYGYEELVSYLDSNSSNYDSIMVSESRPMGQSYIFFLYNLEFPPSIYQENPNKDFDNYKFIDTEEFDVETLKQNELLVIPARQYNEDFRHLVVKTIKYKNNEDAYLVLEGSN